MQNPHPKLITCCCLAIFWNSIITAQVSDHFADGDYTSNPAWAGNVSSWIVNTNLQLQSNNQQTNSSFFLSTENTLATLAQWEFYSRLAFSTSGANYADVYLTASMADLTNTGTTGYFVRLGNTDDEICLYRKDASGNSVKIIDGLNGSIGGSNHTLKIKVTRDANSQWVLYRDNTATGSSFVKEGTVTDSTYLTSGFFGILVKQSTASFFGKHFFDDIDISGYAPDVIPPSIQSAGVTTANTLLVSFSEPVEALTARDTNNYYVPGIGKPAYAVINSTDPSQLTLVFSNSFTTGNSYTVIVNNVQDLAGNPLVSGSAGFTYFIPGRFSVVIDELMVDPVPQVELPNAEWVELKNISPVAINLQDYRLGDKSNLSGPLPSFLLQPDSLVIITASNQLGALSAFGRTIGVTGFPFLSNDAGPVFLQSGNGTIMHMVDYNHNWYQNNVKAEGGWSLEMVDTKNPCQGKNNWKASIANTGGTPGRKNSVDGINKDHDPPALLSAYAIDSLTLLLSFDESLDSSSASKPGSFSINNGIGVVKTAVPQAPLFTTIKIELNTPLVRNQVYKLVVSDVADCSGNITRLSHSVKLGLSSQPGKLDLIINEILFNPKDFGVDYLELFNRGNKIIDLSMISIANRGAATGAMGTPVKIISDHYPLFPGDFILLTSDPLAIKQQYTAIKQGVFITMPLPSFPDTKGSAVILDYQGNILDELTYSNTWHFALLDNEQGVSLERIDYNRPTNESTNWSSAAASAGFGTPGYINSQYRSDLSPQASITVTPKMISPDNDGFEDFAFISFHFPEPGYVVNITIYDAAGRPVRVLQRNTTTAANGVFRWDGLDDKLQKVPVGPYILHTDIFNLKGQQKQFKNTVVVARKW